MSCRLCSNWALKPCATFLGPHRFCHACGMTRLVHELAAKRVAKPAPVLTVIEGGKGDVDDCWSAWMNGEVNQ